VVPKTARQLETIPDHRWLAMMTRCIFQAGFNWKVIDNKWPGFEDAFEGFNPVRWAMAPDEDLDALARDTRIVRNPQKIITVRDNAVYVQGLVRDHGSAGAFFSKWPSTDQVGLMAHMKKHASRMGGNSAQYFLRFMGKDGFMLSRDVVAALIREGVVDRQPTSKADLAQTQEAFNVWTAQSRRPMTQVSRTLAMSVGV
jgi:3-methyladenine DNA glycosylase Tag